MPETSPSTPAGVETILPLRFVDHAHPEPKKKKAHKKSRGGCASCKKRKVKCDELLPCTNCLRRNEKCVPSHKSSTPETEPSPDPPRPLDSSGPVNLLHMELFHHFQQTTAPSLCFANVWSLAIPLAFREEYLMTAMLALSARHLTILHTQIEEKYTQASLALVSRSCALFSVALDREDSGDKCDPLFFTAQLIHYLTWCNLEFLEQNDSQHRLDLSRDQLFLLSSGVRVFLSGTRAHGSDSIFVKMSQVSECAALDGIIAGQGMDRGGIVEAFMQKYDGLTPNALTHGPAPSNTREAEEREAFRLIVGRLAVLLALWKFRDSNPSPPATGDLERFALAFPLFCTGAFLDMIVANDSRALLVLYHFYRTFRLLSGARETWWASERCTAMENLIGRELERRCVDVSLDGLG
ncbi:Sterol uptake control protein 2-like protein 10 [Colletotrichum chlorophyti]|uniref:Sterol uptake control protein 2-like protein 10 n=1 Tax=Colletotrichum chlorophyti TaxID=708187 RepID=A0A1Q8RFZ2_9PEZI|nr:Sterol uptake control protein 2-like protein 10 [Colletotrichum chlorophyti]